MRPQAGLQSGRRSTSCRPIRFRFRRCFLQRGDGDFRWRAGPDRHADRRPRVVHALADHRGRSIGGYETAATSGGAGRRVEKRRFLDLIRHFIVFEDVGGGVLVKKMAGYHQYHAVNVAVQETIRACVPSAKPWQVREGEGTISPKARRTPNPATSASAWCGIRKGRARA